MMPQILRARIGKQGDGSVAIRISKPGVDLRNADPDDTDETIFNSDWENLLKTHQVGLISGLVKIADRQTVVFPALNDIPFMEVRPVNGTSIVYDDRLIKSNFGGFQTRENIFETTLAVNRFSTVVVENGKITGAFYIIYKDLDIN